MTAATARLWLCVLGVIAGTANATANALPELSSLPNQDKISLAACDHFWERWHLVSVRYRNDTGEQRFVYANPLAWRAMQRGVIKYPDGSMFGKLAFFTRQDSLFPVSVEPAGFSRLQIMKKDAKAYPDTDGWGYAIVGSPQLSADTAGEPIHAPANDGTHKIDARALATACHACHRLAKERGFVFTRSPFLGDAPQNDAAHAPAFKSSFRKRAIRELTPFEQNVIATVREGAHDDGFASVNYSSMALFIGSVNESLPVLQHYAEADHEAYMLSDLDKNAIVVVYPASARDGTSQKCVRIGVTYYGHTPAPSLRVTMDCQGRIAHENPIHLSTARP